MSFLDRGDSCAYDVDSVFALIALGGPIAGILELLGICDPTCRCVNSFCILL